MQDMHLSFLITNNEAKYKALLVGFSITKVVGVEKVEILTDSQLIAKQINGDFLVKGKRMEMYVKSSLGNSTRMSPHYHPSYQENK